MFASYRVPETDLYPATACKTSEIPAVDAIVLSVRVLPPCACRTAHRASMSSTTTMTSK